LSGGHLPAAISAASSYAAQFDRDVDSHTPDDAALRRLLIAAAGVNRFRGLGSISGFSDLLSRHADPALSRPLILGVSLRNKRIKEAERFSEKNQRSPIDRK
jgi:hypothetical protein